MPFLLPGPGVNPSAGQTEQQHSTPCSSQKSGLWSNCSKPRKKKFTQVSGMCGLWKHKEPLLQTLSQSSLLLQKHTGSDPANLCLSPLPGLHGLSFLPHWAGSSPAPLKVTETPEQMLPSSTYIRSTDKAQVGCCCHRLFSLI